MQTRSLTIDGFCQQHQFKPTLIKIDVEGFEWSVLEGSRKLLHQFKPNMFVEVFPESKTKRDVWDFLQSLGYHAYALTSDDQQPVQRIKSVEQFVTTKSADFIFLADLSFASQFEDDFLKSKSR